MQVTLKIQGYIFYYEPYKYKKGKGCLYARKVHHNLIRPVSESESNSSLLLASLVTAPAAPAAPGNWSLDWPGAPDISGLESGPSSGDTQQSPSSEEHIWV